MLGSHTKKGFIPVKTLGYITQEPEKHPVQDKEEIEFCMNCTKKDCPGNCSDMKRFRNTTMARKPYNSPVERVKSAGRENPLRRY